MNSTEIIILISIFIIQLAVLLIASLNIKKLNNFIPHEEDIKIKIYTFPSTALRHDLIPNIVEELDTHDTLGLAVLEKEQNAEIPLLEPNPDHSEDYQSITKSINIYLLRNYGAIADFNVIRDLINQKLEYLQGKAQSLVYTPLYLGLLGTIMGVVMGLLSMNSQSENQLNLLHNFIPNVVFAMSVSAAGLIITILLSYVFLRKALDEQEKRKGAMLSLLQLELMPVVNQGMTDTFLQLQRTLSQFNKEFGQHTKEFFEISKQNTKSFETSTEVMNNFISKNNAVIQKQSELIKAINEANIQSITNANLQIMTKLNQAFEKFDAFATYMNNINGVLHNSNEILGRLDNLLIQTGKLSALTQKLDERLDLSNTIMEFLKAHLEKINNVSDTIINQIQNLGQKANNTIEAFDKEFKESSASHLELLQNTYDDFMKENEKMRQNANRTLVSVQEVFEEGVKEHSKKLSETFNQLLQNIPEFHQRINQDFTNLSNHIQEHIQNIKDYETQIVEKLKNEGIFLQNLRYLEPITQAQLSLNRELQTLEDIKLLLCWLIEVETEKSKGIFTNKRRIQEINDKYYKLQENLQNENEEKYNELEKSINLNPITKQNNK